MGANAGPDFLAADRAVLRGKRGAGTSLPAPSEAVTNVLHIISGVISLGLLVYLTVALLKPEWFK
jgi:K+-transporting ATPase KdpF subunit